MKRDELEAWIERQGWLLLGVAYPDIKYYLTPCGVEVAVQFGVDGFEITPRGKASGVFDATIEEEK